MPGAERAEAHPELGLQSFAEGVTMVTMVLGDIAPLHSKRTTAERPTMPGWCTCHGRTGYALHCAAGLAGAHPAENFTCQDFKTEKSREVCGSL